MSVPRPLKSSPRLTAAMTLLRGCDTVADIGCDHGRLAVSLIESGQASLVLATDVSVSSLQKCSRLAKQHLVLDRIRTFVGDGFLPLSNESFDGAALMGMGGSLIRRIIEEAPCALTGKRLVLQPMCDSIELRRYLTESGCAILAERVVSDGGRLYQLLAAEYGAEKTPWPKDFPKDCYELGALPCQRRDPLYYALAEQLLKGHTNRLLTARGSDGEKKLLERIEALQQILRQRPKE